MAGEDAAAGGTAAAKKLPKEEDDDELDNVPLAVSRAKKARNASASKVKKEEEEEDDDEEDNLPISHSRSKKVCCLRFTQILFFGLFGGRAVRAYLDFERFARLFGDNSFVRLPSVSSFYLTTSFVNIENL